MTNKEFYTVVKEANLSEEITAFAEAAIAKIDAAAEKKRNTPSKAALENAELAKALAEIMEIDKVYTAAELAELGELANASKATAVAKVLVADGKAISEDVKGPKGKCKGYTLVEKYED